MNTQQNSTNLLSLKSQANLVSATPNTKNHTYKQIPITIENRKEEESMPLLANTRAREDAARLLPSYKFPSYKYGIGMIYDTSWMQPLKKDLLEFERDDNAFETAKKILADDAKFLYSLVNPDDDFEQLHVAQCNFYDIVQIKEDDTKIIDINARETAFAHTTIIAHPCSSGTVYVKVNSDNNVATKNHTKYHSHMIEVLAKKGAEITVVVLNDLAQDITLKCTRRAQLESHAKVTWLTCDMGAKQAHIDCRSFLKGKEAKVESKNILYLTGTQRIVTTVAAQHNDQKTRSDLDTKGVLAQNAYLTYRGLIDVQPHCTKVTGHQNHHSTLLGAKAKIDAIPDLAIAHDDVVSSHASSIGELDNDTVFYLQSRGLSKKEALALLLLSQATPIIKALEHVDKIKGTTEAVQLQEKLQKYIQGVEHDITTT